MDFSNIYAHTRKAMHRNFFTTCSEQFKCFLRTVYNMYSQYLNCNGQKRKKNEIYQLRSESSMANSTAHHKADIVTTSLSYTILVECVSLPDDRMSSDLSVIFTQSLQIRREKLPEKRDR